MKVHLDKESGFSMLEVLLASVVLSIVLGLVMSVQLFALQAAKRADLSSEASVLAGNLAEHLQLISGQDEFTKVVTKWQHHLSYDLPHPRGIVKCHDGHCVVLVSWKTKQLHSIRLDVRYGKQTI